jgi:hypothetical protein
VPIGSAGDAAPTVRRGIDTDIIDRDEGDTVRRQLAWRLQAEGVAAGTAFVLLGLTLVWPRWIELVFGVDPDGGSGALEWLIVLVSSTVLLAASTLAWRHRRRSVGWHSPTSPASGTKSCQLT